MDKIVKFNNHLQNIYGFSAIAFLMLVFAIGLNLYESKKAMFVLIGIYLELSTEAYVNGAQ